jgi:hypothetical protein
MGWDAMRCDAMRWDGMRWAEKVGGEGEAGVRAVRRAEEGAEQRARIVAQQGTLRPDAFELVTVEHRAVWPRGTAACTWGGGTWVR